MTIKKLRRITAIGIVLGLLAAGVWAAVRHALRDKVLVTISKETTVITEPLRSDGYVDYIAAFNRILSKDVSPQNNALVPFWQAMGPTAVPQEIRAAYFQLLGTQAPAENGSYFVPLKDFAQQRQAAGAGFDAIDEQCQTAIGRPWRKNEFPVLAAWLEANKLQLDLVAEASHRPRYFSPLVGGESGVLLNVLLPAAQEIRTASRALIARAMLQLGDRQTEAAWDDLLAAHRWARFCGRGPCLVEALVAQSIDQAACRGDTAICQSVRLTAADALRMRDDLNGLAPLPNVVDIVDRFERCSLLSCVAGLARDGTLSADGKNHSRNPVDPFINGITWDTIDWNTPLRIMNTWFDRDVAALRLPTAKEQQAAFDQIHEQLRLIADSRTSGAPSLVSFHNDFSEFVGQHVAALMLPAVDKANDSAHIAAMRLELTKLSFSLAAYRADHGSYPTQLNELVPKYAGKIPTDVFNGNELHYKPDGGGYELYSVGRNGIDDGGRGTDDRKDGDDCDDIVVRVEKIP